MEHSVQTFLLLEFGAFVQKSDKKLNQTFNRFNHLLSRMLKHNLKYENIEQVTFMNGLRPKWKAVVSIVKSHEQFKSNSLAKLVGILRSHEDEATKDIKLVSSMGSLALVEKKVAEEDFEFDFSDSELNEEEYALMVSNPKKFIKKNFGRFKNRKRQGNFSSENSREESFKNSQKEEEKQEKKLLGDPE